MQTKVIEIAPGPGLWWIDKATGEKPVPGDIFYAPYCLKEPYRRWLSAGYWALPEPRRDPIVVVLPNGIWFVVDDQASGARGQPTEPGWIVTGPIERLTVSPSIDNQGPGGWHGWLREGVLSP